MQNNRGSAELFGVVEDQTARAGPDGDGSGIPEPALAGDRLFAMSRLS